MDRSQLSKEQKMQSLCESEAALWKTALDANRNNVLAWLRSAADVRLNKHRPLGLILRGIKTDRASSLATIDVNSVLSACVLVALWFSCDARRAQPSRRL